MQGPELKHVAAAGSTSPVSRLVAVPPGMTTYHLSGQMPQVLDPARPADSIEAYGNLYDQTLSTLQRIEAILQAEGLGLGDLVYTRASIVKGPGYPALDFPAFNRAYAEAFAATPGRYPARMVMEIAGLVNPGWLLEIEAVAAR
ncbi:2-aminomuconate deaminase [Pigmentiphaga humi]|uniref:2-aminomuconate deaminase n=1 Tax=Pigmentiphaga humi TaxID=2478468 RepID=A0A3P4B578_9BURK|nr:Rid family hydrolase [Pigmentiphaga humi]VCU71061.1 2-aminomuconate deaminase [Pigmentiphaga humi]